MAYSFSSVKNPNQFYSVFHPPAVLAQAHICQSRGVWRSKAPSLTLEFTLRKSTFPSSRLVQLPRELAGEL